MVFYENVPFFQLRHLLIWFYIPQGLTHDVNCKFMSPGWLDYVVSHFQKSFSSILFQLLFMTYHMLSHLFNIWVLLNLNNNVGYVVPPHVSFSIFLNLFELSFNYYGMENFVYNNGINCKCDIYILDFSAYLIFKMINCYLFSMITTHFISMISNRLVYTWML